MVALRGYLAKADEHKNSPEFFFLFTIPGTAPSGTNNLKDMATATTKAKPQNGQKVSKKKKAEELEAMQHEMLDGLPEMIMPYTARLSFAPLLRLWETKVDSEDVSERLIAREIMKRVDAHPEIWNPIDDYAELEKYPELVDLLLSGLFPLGLRETQMGKASKPFDMYGFFKTAAAKRMMMGCSMNVKIEKSTEFFFNSMVVKAASYILNAHYGQNLDVDPTVVFTLEPKNRVDVTRHFKSELNINFSEVVAVKPLKELSQEKINSLLSNVYDADAWLEALPPENFELHGVVGMNLIDVTREETISRLRYQLLERDAVVKKENVLELEKLLKSYFNIPGLHLGIMAMDYPTDAHEEFKYNIRHCLLDGWNSCLLDTKNETSIYQKACNFQNVLLVEDLKALSHKTPVEEELIKRGYGSILIAPLMDKQKKIIGLMELGAPDAFELNSFAEIQFQNLLPLFNTAVERSRDETDNKIEALIREKFTAIHPSVEWRFSKAAFNLLNAEEVDGQKPTIEEIGFENVYPLYAQSDIVSSSNKRNRAIQEDLLKNLQLIRDMLKTAEKHVDFPLLDQYLLETEHRMEELAKELRSSDESLVIDFILNEVHPLLEEVAQRDTSIALAYSLYQSQLDPHLGVVYHKRKDYEDSVTRINQTISDYLEKEDERSQKMLPHYFEKYKTDGVQFELYVGQSVLQRGEFNDMHLRNFRLWQLQAIAEITRQMEQLKTELPLPLETAQLIFVYGQPISIRFRIDDKRFDVDGAYNIRYEIIKKRIDKAMVTMEGGKRERLTQAGKIAIVYAAEKDREEYLNYLTYLKRQGLIEPDIEDLELDKLQGVQGLKALRVTVK